MHHRAAHISCRMYRGISCGIGEIVQNWSSFLKRLRNGIRRRARFWAAEAQGSVRKIHSGIVSIVIDRYRDIVLADMDGISFGEGKNAIGEQWQEIFEKGKINEVLGEGIAGTLASGDRRV